MKHPGLILLSMAFMAGALGYSCRQAGNQENRLPAWSSNDPLAIPYFIRQQKADKGNLVRNGSFEIGKWLSVDSLTQSYSIDGWQKRGTHVTWVDLGADTGLPGAEVYSGQHAIRIIRTAADEMVSEGEGIMSNFIRVIPGNYSFSFYARMLDIRPYSARLGTRMHDAVEIKLFFFDKNKIPVSSRSPVPFKGQQIDNSFKSLSLANFDHIKEFGWGRIIGKSHSFPFHEGDIPDNARYVKLFIGLKGTGTLWVDDVDFHYTRSNFTPLERITLIVDSSLTKQDLIVPTPKQVDRLASVVLYKQGQVKEALPRIVMPSQPGEDTRRAVSLLHEKLVSCLSNAGAGKNDIDRLEPQTSIGNDELSQSGMVFSVGRNSLYYKYREMLPVKAVTGHDQGYFVYTSNDLPNVVFLAGNDETGDYYAAATVVQLFDNRFPVFYNARIIDYPDVLQRFFQADAWKDEQELDRYLNTVQDLLPFKVNGTYISIGLDKDLATYSRLLTSYASHWQHSDAFNFMQWIVPASADSFWGWESAPAERDCSIPDDKKTEELVIRLMDAGHQANALGISIAPSFICPCDSTLGYNLSGVLKLADNFRNETGFLLRLQQHMRSRYPSGILEYCLPWYNNELIDYSLGYADALLATSMDEIDEQVSLLWSGSSFYTVKTDAADIFRYEGLLKNKTVLLDNSLLTASKKAGYGGAVPYFPRKLRLYNFLEPYENAELYFYRHLLNHKRVLINQQVQSELEKIKILTANDFYWNMQAYDPDFSLWKILVSRYGIAVAEELMMFGDVLAGMLEINLRLQQRDQVNKNYRAGGEAMAKLQQHIDQIAATLGNDHVLVAELKALCLETRNAMESMVQPKLP